MCIHCVSLTDAFLSLQHVHLVTLGLKILMFAPHVQRTLYQKQKLLVNVPAYLIITELTMIQEIPMAAQLKVLLRIAQV